jgi:hypothetical protein
VHWNCSLFYVVVGGPLYGGEGPRALGTGKKKKWFLVINDVIEGKLP